MLEIMTELNEMLMENDLGDDFCFSCHTNGVSEGISLVEMKNFGHEIPLIDSDNLGFNEWIEDMYENDRISYKLAVKLQILENLKNIVSDLQNVVDAVAKMS